VFESVQITEIPEGYKMIQDNFLDVNMCS
jgi:hypothetical protein